MYPVTGEVEVLRYGNGDRQGCAARKYDDASRNGFSGTRVPCEKLQLRQDPQNSPLQSKKETASIAAVACSPSEFQALSAPTPALSGTKQEQRRRSRPESPLASFRAPSLPVKESAQRRIAGNFQVVCSRGLRKTTAGGERHNDEHGRINKSILMTLQLHSRRSKGEQ